MEGGVLCAAWYQDLRPCLSLDTGSVEESLRVGNGVRESCTKRTGASNMNIHYDVTSLLSAVWKVTIRSTCLGCLSWPERRRLVYL